MAQLKLQILWLAIGCLSLSQALNSTESSGSGKVLSIFNLVRFQNAPCAGTGTRNGTCFTPAECTTRGGLASGTCASGFGVCCIFTIGCGGMSSQNCTYFTSGTNPLTPSCQATICPCDTNICQLRLDFTSFSIAQPSADINIAGSGQFGQITGLGEPLTTSTQCLTDTFSVTSDGPSPAPICGLNTGEHMYVDALEDCNMLTFQLGMPDPGNRMFDIKVTQLRCSDDNLAPQGCVKYFFGQGTGMVMTYNFLGGRHLSGQNEKICVRRELGMCRICWSAAMGDFQTSVGGAKSGSNCCAYNTKGTQKNGFDCLFVTGATLKTKTSVLIPKAASKFCGSALGVAKGKAIAVKTVCSQTLPFMVRFLSDTFDTSLEAMKTQKGFRLMYQMLPCNAGVKG